MVGGHHQLDGQEFEQAPGDGEGQYPSLTAWSAVWTSVIYGVTNRHDLATEQQESTTLMRERLPP